MVFHPVPLIKMEHLARVWIHKFVLRLNAIGHGLEVR
jgi:hypothetical protein